MKIKENLEKFIYRIIILPFYIIFYAGETYSYLLKLLKIKFYLKWLDLFNMETDKKFIVIKHKSSQNKFVNIKFSTPNSRCKHRAETFSIKEPETLEWIDRQKYKGVFFDVGANIGLYSTYYSITKNGKVFAFEPSIFNIYQLAKNININNLNKNICIIKNPLGDQNQISKLSFNKLDYGGSEVFFGKEISKSLKKNNYNFKHNFSYDCLGLSIDFLIENKIIDYPNCMKIDVDGTEQLILQGAKKVLLNKKLTSILIEVNHLIKDLTTTVEKTLTNFGFKKSETRTTKNFNQIWDR